MQTRAEFLQCILCLFTEFVRGRFGLQAVEGNLHLDADSANLTAPVLHQNDQFRCELAQFRGDSGIGNGDTERAQLQAQYLDGLGKMGRGNSREVALQV